MTDIAALIEETEHLLAILEYRQVEEISYDYVRHKIDKAKDALSRLAAPPLQEEIAALIERVKACGSRLAGTYSGQEMMGFFMAEIADALSGLACRVIPRTEAPAMRAVLEAAINGKDRPND